MSTLHTINKSPFEKSSLEACLRLATKGNTILFYEDGVYGAMKGTAVADKIKSAMNNLTVCALGPDLKARGIDAGKLIDGIKIVDYSDFVKMTVANDKVQSWI